MFSGLGSIADLNQQFAQFTSNLTNLDTLQDGSEGKTANVGTQNKDKDNEYKVKYEAAMESLASASVVSDAQQFEIGELQRAVADLREQLSAANAEFDIYKKESEQRLSEAVMLKSSATEVQQGQHASTINIEGNDAVLAELQAHLEATELANVKLKIEIRTLSEKLLSKEKSLADALQERNEEIAKLEAELQKYITSIVEASDARTALESQVQDLQMRLAKAEGQLEQSRQTAQQNSEVAKSSLTESETLQAQMMQAQQAQSEAEGKVATLTEKLKDMMHRFAELKSKSAAQLQQAEDKYRDLTKIAQAKDSEIVALKLKNENVDRSSSDLRLKANELAERYSESQREVARLREAAEAAALLTATLVEERDRALEQIRNDAAEHEQVVAQRTDLQQQLAAIQTEHCSQLQRFQEERQREAQADKDLIAQLQAELTLAANRMKQDADSAGNLEQYKKKAQLALKKANATVATLTTEVQQLRISAEESAARLQEATEAARLAEEQRAELQMKLQEALQESTRLLDEQRLRESAEAHRTQDLEALVASQKDKIFELEGELGRLQDALRSHQQSKGSQHQTHGRPGYVAVGATRTAQGQEEDSASSASAESEMSVPPVPSSTSATAASGLQGHVSADRSGVRESSWAMVASATASAPDSRLSSAHPSNATIEKSAGPAGVDTSPSEGQEGTEFRTAPSAESLLFISQLQQQLESLKKSLAQRGIDLEAAHHQLQYERDEKRILQARVEELRAYLDRLKQQDGPDSATNMEYLKNCVFKFMSSTDFSERRRLYPVISTVLKFTSQEMKAVEAAFREAEARDNELQDTISTIGSFATSLWGTAASTILGGSDTSSSNSSSGSEARGQSSGRS